MEKEVGKEVGVAVFGFDHSRWIASRGASNTVPPAAQANRKCEVEKHAKPLENVAFLRGEIGCARHRLGFDHSRWIASRGTGNTVPPAALANRRCEVENNF